MKTGECCRTREGRRNACQMRLGAIRAVGFARDHTDKRNVTEELPSLRPATRLGPQGIGRFSGERAGANEDVGAAIDQREHVRRLGCLRVAMTAKANNVEPDRSEHLRDASDQPWVVDEVGDHGTYKRLKRIELADRHSRRRVIAVE